MGPAPTISASQVELFVAVVIYIGVNAERDEVSFVVEDSAELAQPVHRLGSRPCVKFSFTFLAARSEFPTG